MNACKESEKTIEVGRGGSWSAVFFLFFRTRKKIAILLSSINHQSPITRHGSPSPHTKEEETVGLSQQPCRVRSCCAALLCWLRAAAGRRPPAMREDNKIEGRRDFFQIGEQSPGDIICKREQHIYPNMSTAQRRMSMSSWNSRPQMSRKSIEPKKKASRMSMAPEIMRNGAKGRQSMGRKSLNPRESMAGGRKSLGPRESMAGRKSLGGRESMAPNGRVARVKDPRKLSDKAYMRTQIRNLIDYLTSNCYEHPISPKILTSPTRRDFQNVISFLFHQIDPGFEFGPKFEDDVINFLKAMKYPIGISKTSLSAVGSSHTWPALLGALSWLVELLNVCIKCFSFRAPVRSLCIPST